MLQIILYLLLTQSIYAERAIVIKPVADLLGSPRTTTAPIPYAHKPAGAHVCPRLHQLLYHDAVDIIKRVGEYAYVKLPNVWFQTATSTERCNRCWIHTDDLVTEKNCLPDQWTLITEHILAPATYGYITIIKPCHCTALNITFSVGTTLHRTAAPATDVYTVYAMHPHRHTVVTITVPQEYAYEPSTHTIMQRYAMYQDLIKRWALEQQIVPYVWGGCSLQHTYCNNCYQEVQHDDIKVYRRLHEPIQKSGVDCAGLIMLAARTAGLPYQLKNSTTIARNGASTAAADLEVGDILWIPGHVMLIIDPHKGMLLEASHYTHGVGCIHAVHISKLFKDINTFADIERTLAKKMPLQRLDRNGKIYQEIRQAKFISMRKTIQKRITTTLAQPFCNDCFTANNLLSKAHC